MSTARRIFALVSVAAMAPAAAQIVTLPIVLFLHLVFGMPMGRLVTIFVFGCSVGVAVFAVVVNSTFDLRDKPLGDWQPWILGGLVVSALAWPTLIVELVEAARREVLSLAVILPPLVLPAVHLWLLLTDRRRPATPPSATETFSFPGRSSSRRG